MGATRKCATGTWPLAFVATAGVAGCASATVMFCMSQPAQCSVVNSLAEVQARLDRIEVMLGKGVNMPRGTKVRLGLGPGHSA